ncbi:hypothetical protein I3842_10G126100 [Carya illinoinensis]|uniref:Uncharacterized protein n=1 Tax=Carya illinoinensis TaxID=32201 RepID=A0A922DXP0_CARIL|nr:hypothetical protein I3842_10G126100 [Carya illinoinensis]
MRQKIFFIKRFDLELLYRFALTLSVSTNNSKCLDFFRTGLSQIAMIRNTSFYTISETQGLNAKRMQILFGQISVREASKN